MTDTETARRLLHRSAVGDHVVELAVDAAEGSFTVTTRTASAWCAHDDPAGVLLHRHPAATTTTGADDPGAALAAYRAAVTDLLDGLSLARQAPATA